MPKMQRQVGFAVTVALMLSTLACGSIGEAINANPAVQTGQAVAATDADDAEDTIVFDRMTEEDLLAGIEGLVPPEKSDDY